MKTLSPVVQKFILEANEGEIRQYLNTIEAIQAGMKDFNLSLVELVENEYIHMRTAIETSPNVDELMMNFWTTVSLIRISIAGIRWIFSWRVGRSFW